MEDEAVNLVVEVDDVQNDNWTDEISDALALHRAKAVKDFGCKDG